MRLFKRSQSVKVVPNQTFLDGQNRYEKGKAYKVEIGLARYFERNGWIEGSLAAPPPVTVLDVDDSVLGHNGGM